MRKLLFLLQSIALSAQVGIGTDDPDPSAVLELNGDGKQGLLMPKVTDYQSITNAPAGLIVYDSIKKAIYFSDGTYWNKVNPSKIECNTFDYHAFDQVLQDKKLAYILAMKFAPILKFDKEVYDNYYPTSLENIFNWSDTNSITCGGKLATHDTDQHKGGKNFPTYYGVQENPYHPERVFIDYWLFYIRQSNCKISFRFTSKKVGGHDYDLEHIVVQADKTRDKVYSVTYFQHAGWYTRNWDKIETQGTHAVAYVGRKCHGMYYDGHKGSSESCRYFQDSREPSQSTIVNTEYNLREMSSDAYGFGFNGSFGDPGKGPLYRDRKYWSFNTCKGDSKLLSFEEENKAPRDTNSSLPQSGCKANDPYKKDLKIGEIPN